MGNVASGTPHAKNCDNQSKTTPAAPNSERMADPTGGAKQGDSTREGRDLGGSKRESLFVTSYVADVRVRYHVQPKELGHGHYGVVRKCQNRQTGEWFAIKTIRKSKVHRLESLKREIEIMQAVDHPNILKLYEVFEDEKYLHLITQLCTGGELFDRIIAKTNSEEGHYSERDAANLVSCMLDAIAYCHNLHICHRDLKPENFLFETPDENANLKIIDFGLSRVEDMGNQGVMTTRVGTPYYIAPEVLGRHYTKACDLWSIGVITYILLCGYPPFYGDNDTEIFASVQRGVFYFPSPEWDSICDEAKSLIQRLLSKQPGDRPTAEQALADPWFEKALSDERLNQPMKIAPFMRDRLKQFVGMNKLKKHALNVIATQLTEQEIGHLKKVFSAIDDDGNGVITLDELRMAMRMEGMEAMEAEVMTLMEGIDIDGSHSLDYQEFLAAVVDRNVFIKEENIRLAFQHFDKEGSGVIRPQDLVEIFGSIQHAQEVIGGIDLNGDGIISYDEFKEMMQG